MPGAAKPALAVDAFFDRALAERAALVRAAIVHRGVAPVEVDEGEGFSPRRNRRHPAFRQLIRIRNPMPFQRAGVILVRCVLIHCRCSFRGTGVFRGSRRSAGVRLAFEHFVKKRLHRPPITRPPVTCLLITCT